MENNFIVIAGQKGPQGPAGPAGSDGINGTNGSDGLPGQILDGIKITNTDSYQNLTGSDLLVFFNHFDTNNIYKLFRVYVSTNPSLPTKIYNVPDTADIDMQHIDMFCIVPNSYSLSITGVKNDNSVDSNLIMYNLVAFRIS